MHLSINHVTKFRYSAPITESIMELRMQPLTEGPQRCLKFDLSLKPSARYTSYRDSDFEYYLAQRSDLPLAGVILKNKGHVYPALKVFFSKEKRI